MITTLALFFTIGTVLASAPESYESIVKEYEGLTKNRIANIKEGSKPFFLGQGQKGKTVVLFHGLSDSPGSMKEISTVYQKQGYNVFTLMLRDHGLIKELRNEARSAITLDQWREDIDNMLKVAFKMSLDGKVAVAGYSLGGALVIDTAHRYPGKISSIVMMAPMFKMMYSPLTPLTKYLKKIVYATQKGIDEMPHFYPDIALNQTFHASELTRYLKRHVTKKPTADLLSIPKIIFLTTADTTIINKFDLITAARLQIPDENIIMYTNDDPEHIVLHRDLPMRAINANGNENPHLDDMLNRVDNFLTKQQQ